MRSYDNPNCIVRREQTAVDGTFLFFQKAKLKAIHVFGKKDAAGKTADKAGELDLVCNDETIGKVVLTESFGAGVQSSGLLDVVIPQGSVVYVTGDAAGFGVVAEYEVMPDADETTTNVERR